MKICMLFYILIMISGVFGQRKCFVYIAKKFSNTFKESEISDILTNCIANVIYVNDTQPECISSLITNLMSWKEEYHFSFLSAAVSRSIQGYCREENIHLWDMNEHRTLEILSIDGNIICDATYFQISNLLVDTTSVRNIAIVRYTSSSCYNKIADKLFDDISNEILSHTPSTNSLEISNISMFDISNYDNITSILHVVHELKYRQIYTIVMLLPADASLLFWEISHLFNLNKYDHLWFTFETINHIAYSNYIPWQFIDIQADTVIQSVQNMRSIVPKVLLEVNIMMSRPKVVKESGISVQKTNDVGFNIEMKRVIEKNISAYTRDPMLTKTLVFSKVLALRNNETLEIVKNFEFITRLIRTPKATKKLKIVSVNEAPFTELANHLYDKETKRKCLKGSLICHQAVLGLPDNDPRKWEETCCVGMMIDLLIKVAADLYFDYEVYLVEDGYYGSLSNSNGTLQWNGLVKDIYDKKADIAFAAITPTEERARYVDFTEPYMETDISLIASAIAPPISFINWEFLLPLEENLRIWLVVTFAIGTILIYVLENQVLVLKRITDKSAHARYQWREGFSYFSGLTFQRDLGGKNPQKAGARVTAIAFAFGMVIIMTTYTAVLTASKVSQENSNVFVGFSDPKITNPTYEFPFASIAHSSMEDFFRYSPDPTHRRMYMFMRQFRVNSTAEGIELVTRKVLGAFIAETPVLLHQQSFNCTLKIFGKAIQQSGYALMIPKDSPWKHLLSETILTLKLNEKIFEIQKKWFPPTCLLNASVTPAYESVEINYFGGLILVLCSFFVISFGFLGLEYFCHRHHRRVINPIQDKVQVWRETRAAERRNALIDPRDVSMLQKRIKENQIEVSSDVDSVISEGEEELIRMRMRMTRGRKSTVNKISYQSDTLSFATTTSSIGSSVSTRHRSTLEKLDIEIQKHSILDIIEMESGEYHQAEPDGEQSPENDLILVGNRRQAYSNSRSVKEIDLSKDETKFDDDDTFSNITTHSESSQETNNDNKSSVSIKNVDSYTSKPIDKTKIHEATSCTNLKTNTLKDTLARRRSLDSQLSTKDIIQVVTNLETLRVKDKKGIDKGNNGLLHCNGVHYCMNKQPAVCIEKPCIVNINDTQVS